MNQTQNLIWQHIRVIADFPKNGINFYDLSPLFETQIKLITDALIQSIPDDVLAQTDSFIAVEARGFILAGFLAQKLGKGLILVRKAGKLPPPTKKISYQLEYGEDSLEMANIYKPQKVLLVDDVLATGGTLKTAAQLALQCNHTVLGASVLLDMPNLHSELDLRYWHVIDDLHLSKT